MRPRHRILATLFIACMTASIAQAQIATIGQKIEPEIFYSPEGKDDDKIPLLKELRGGIAFFYFWRPNDLRSIEGHAAVKALHDEVGKLGVRFASVIPDDKDKLREISADKPVDFYDHPLYNGRGVSYRLGALSEPYYVIVDPYSVLIWRGADVKQAGERLRQLLERTPPPCANAEWLNQRYRLAERLQTQGEYGRAYTTARDLYEITTGESMHSKARGLMDRLEIQADAWLKKAIELEGKREFEEAARIVAEISVRFVDPDDEDDGDKKKSSGNRDDDNLAINRKAEREIGRMNGTRELKQLIRDAQENARASLRNDTAAGFEEDGMYLEAREIYREVVKEFEDTKAAEEAQARLDYFKETDAVQERIGEQRKMARAYRRLDLGDRFASFKLYEQAREQYEKVIAEAPDTIPGRHATARLEQLPKASAKSE